MKKIWKSGFVDEKFEKKSLRELFEIKFNWYNRAYECFLVVENEF